MNKFSIFALPLAALALSACATVGGDTLPDYGEGASAADMPTQAETETILLDHIKVLASDDYMGRKPGTEGERLTVAYQIDRLTEYGFEPGWNGSFEQKVPFKSEAPVAVALNVNGTAIAASDIVTFGNRVDFTGADLVKIDNVAQIDGSVKGRILLIDNPMLLQSAGGRAEAEGARGVVMLGGKALYDRFKANAGRPSVEIDASADGTDDESMSFLLLGDDAGAKFKAALNAAGGNTLAADYENEASRFTSSNVVAKLPGSRPEAGAVVMLAHWDHLGTCGEEGDADRICNGAADNASGIAAMLETARRLAMGPQLERDVYILGTTSEELGLLGARYFADHPPRPLDEIHAALNIDMISIAPAGKPLTVIGWKRTPLDDSISGVAASLGRKVEVGEESDMYVRRQDGWALMNKGVPSVLVSSSFGDKAILDAFMSSRYHRASDQLWDGFELGGAAEDVPVYVALMRHWATEALYSKPVGWTFEGGEQ